MKYSFEKFAALSASMTSVIMFYLHVWLSLSDANTPVSADANTFSWLALCVSPLILISVVGITVQKNSESPVLVRFGLLGYCLFVLLFLLGINRVLHGNPELEKPSMYTLDGIQIPSALCAALATAGLGVGNFFYGLATKSGSGIERVLSNMLFVWIIFSALVLLADSTLGPRVGSIASWVASIYQLVVRSVMALWLWQTNPMHRRISQAA